MSFPAKYMVMAVCSVFILSGCGPETIFLRPGLDTPSLHVSNGNKFLERGKFESALREFNRASELDPNYIPAYIGLAMLNTHQGDFNKGMEFLDVANQLAVTRDEKLEVEKAYEKLEIIRKKIRNDN